MSSQQYSDVFEYALLPFSIEFHGETWLFQEDNGLIHTSNNTKEFLFDTGAEFLDLPARSPELNPIENSWCILARIVYNDFRQFDVTDSLKETIRNSWDSIDVR